MPQMPLADQVVDPILLEAELRPSMVQLQEALDLGLAHSRKYLAHLLHHDAPAMLALELPLKLLHNHHPSQSLRLL
jgi:hypothetical protein